MKIAGPWMSVAAAGLLSTSLGAAVALAGPPELPLRPLAVAKPPADGNHILVTVPPGMATERVMRGSGALPVPLARLAADSRVTTVSRIDETTWRVVGDLSAAQISAATGLPAVPDSLAAITGTSDTYWSLLWGLENKGGQVGGYPASEDADVDGPEANERGSGAGVIVAVIDSGIQADHPDLPRLWRNTREIRGNGLDDDGNGFIDDTDGWDFLNDDNTPYDPGADNDHGTHVAGTIAAVPDNGRGVAGLAPGVTLMSLKITDGGSIYLADAAAAVRYAADQGAKVVNASFGTNPGAPIQGARALQDAVAYAASKGTIVCAAAGNNGVNTDVSPVWPAGFPLDNVISVGASTAVEQAASFSNFGVQSVDLFAPGHYIASTVGGSRYAALQGTSMATPHVTAAAALLLAREPSLSPAQVRAKLMASVDGVPAFANRSVSGGRLNAAQLIAPGDEQVTVEAASFEGFADGEEHTGTLTIKAARELFPGDVRVTLRGRLLTAIDDVVYAVAEQPVEVNRERATTDAAGAVPLDSAEGVLPAESTLTGEGVRVAFGTVLPAGHYALVVDIVAVADPRYGYGRPVAVYFDVIGGDAPPASPTAPAPSPSSGTQPAPSPSPGSGGGWSPPPSGGGTQPGASPAPVPSSGSGGGGWTPPPTGGGGTSPGTGGGWTPPPTGGGGTSPGSGGGTSPAPSPGTQPPTATPQPPVQHDGITILSVTPDHGSSAGGEILTIVGSNFPEYPLVMVGGAPVYVAARSLMSLAVITPPGVPGSVVDVTVADRSGRAVTMTACYRYDGASSSPTSPQPSQPGTSPGGGDQPSVPGTNPGDGPASPAPAPTSPGQGPSSPAPDASPAPGTSPSPSPAGPAGALLRPGPEVGSVTSRFNLRLAPIIANSPVGPPRQWANWRCVRVTCSGVPV